MRTKLLTLMLFFVGVESASAYIWHNGIYYSILSEEEKTVEVVPVTGKNYSGEIIIPGKIQSGDVEYTVTTIGYQAFLKSKLTKITLPETLVEIGYRAFNGCANLTEIDIPHSVKIIHGGAFKECAISEVKIPDGVECIEHESFAHCWSLQKVHIPNSVTEIGEGAFYHCQKLQEITIPNSVVKIGKSAFQDGIQLKTIIFPESVEEIGDLVLYGCSSLESVFFPSNLKSIGQMSLQMCKSLTAIWMFSKDPSVITVGWQLYDETVKKNCILYVPLGTKEKYQEVYPWCNLKKEEFDSDAAGIVCPYNKLSQNNNVYNLNGQKIDTHFCKKGIFIKNGTKFFNQCN